MWLKMTKHPENVLVTVQGYFIAYSRFREVVNIFMFLLLPAFDRNLQKYAELYLSLTVGERGAEYIHVLIWGGAVS
jgi:hypothetical protein